VKTSIILNVYFKQLFSLVSVNCLVYYYYYYYY